MTNRKGLIALIVFCGLMLGLVYAVSRHSGLSDIPQGASPIRGSEDAFSVSCNVLWRNVQEVLIYDGFQASLINVETGAQNPVPRFSMAYNSVSTGAIRFSPDGKWLLWATGTEQKPLWAATDLITSRSITRPRLAPGPGGDFPSFAWFQDSRRWGERSDSGTYAVIYSVDSPQTRRVALASPDAFADLTGNPRFPPAALPPSSPQMKAVEHAWSPAGDRIAWFMETDDHSIDWAYYVNVLWRLHRIPHNPIPRHQFALWISASDGNHVQNVIPAFSCQYYSPVCLRWTPDGKRLSFNYHRALWIAPIDQTKR